MFGISILALFEISGAGLHIRFGISGTIETNNLLLFITIITAQNCVCVCFFRDCAQYSAVMLPHVSSHGEERAHSAAYVSRIHMPLLQRQSRQLESEHLSPLHPFFLAR